MRFSREQVLQRYLELENARRAQNLLVTAIKDEFFDRQLWFVEDPAREKSALCTRRAGKTNIWPRYCTIVALTTPKGLIRIWAITRLRAKQLLWDEFKDLFQRHRLKVGQDVFLNDTELTIKFANGSEIRLLGADKDKEAQKKRGDKTVMEVVVESQLFGPYLKAVVEDIAGPCLFDLRGTFCLEGTPGPICSGYWFDVSGREDFKSRWISPGGKDGVGSGWSCHRWSVLDNTKIPNYSTVREELARIKAKRRWTDTSPTYVREWLGKWVNDLDALYYAFDPVRNTFTLEEVKPWGPGWEHTLGWDLGARDDMALVVWGYHPKYDSLYEAFSWKEPGALSAQVVGVINDLNTRGVDGVPFNIGRMFADTGGGGKMYVDDVAARYSLSFQPAKKSEKYEHVRLYNDDLRGGFVKILKDSPLAIELAELPRDAEYADDHPDKPPREHPLYPNHCTDASLYSWRACYHYLHQEEKAKPKRGTTEEIQERMAAWEQRLVDKENERLAEKAYEEWLNAEPN